MTCITRAKSAAYVPPLVGLSATSDGTNITVSWVYGAPFYPTQVVVTALRVLEQDTGFTVIPGEARDGGVKLIDGTLLIPEVDYVLWARPETLTNYGEWQGLLVRLEPDWSVGIEPVTMFGEVVTHDFEDVTSPL